jgi:hypothetical protein
LIGVATIGVREVLPPEEPFVEPATAVDCGFGLEGTEWVTTLLTIGVVGRRVATAAGVLTTLGACAGVDVAGSLCGAESVLGGGTTTGAGSSSEGGTWAGD